MCERLEGKRKWREFPSNQKERREVGFRSTFEGWKLQTLAQTAYLAIWFTGDFSNKYLLFCFFFQRETAGDGF